jgi:hypothetical protein
MKKSFLVGLVALSLSGLLFGGDVSGGAEPEKGAAAAVGEKTQAELEKEFEETMHDVYLKGYFTLLGREQQGLKEEKYTINSVKKLSGDKWLFSVRIQYGQHDVALPLTLDVKWAGDTPVITLTDVVIPGFGKFTSRVTIYRGTYAGMWDGGKEPDGRPHGGHLFGVLEKVKAEK